LRLLFQVNLLFAVLLVVSCSSVEKPSDWTVEEFHAKARERLAPESGNKQLTITINSSDVTPMENTLNNPN